MKIQIFILLTLKLVSQVARIPAGIIFCLLTGNQTQIQARVTKQSSGASVQVNNYSAISTRLAAALQENDYKTAAACYQKAGDLFFAEGAMPQALRHYLKASTYYLKQKDYLNLAFNLNRTGRVCFKNAMYEKALINFKQAEILFSKYRHMKGLAESYSYMRQVYELKNKHDSSYLYQEMALTAYKKLRDKSQIALTYAKIGNIYEDRAQYGVALKYYADALKQYKLQSDTAEIPGILNNIGDVYRKSGRYPEALTYSKQAEFLSARLKNNRQLSSAQRDLAKTYEMLGRFDSAYYFSEKARQFYAKSYNEDNTKRLNLIQTLFDVQQKDNEIVRLSHDRQMDKILTISVTVIGLLVAFSGLSLLSRQRLKNSKDKSLYDAHKKAMELELENRNLQQDTLKAELELKSKELTSHTLHIIQKNQFLDELKNKLSSIIKDDKRDQRKELKQLIEHINLNSNHDRTWEDFRVIYENVHEDFFEKLKKHSSSLTAADLRFLALLKMNLSSTDIAAMLSISPDSLRTTRYRVRKKLRLPDNKDLLSFVQSV